MIGRLGEVSSKLHLHVLLLDKQAGSIAWNKSWAMDIEDVVQNEADVLGRIQNDVAAIAGVSLQETPGDIHAMVDIMQSAAYLRFFDGNGRLLFFEEELRLAKGYLERAVETDPLDEKSTMALKILGFFDQESVVTTQSQVARLPGDIFRDYQDNAGYKTTRF